MRTPTLYRYILREILSPFGVSVFVFTGVLFLIRSLDLLDLVITKNVALLDILLLFACIIPRFLEIALPMSLLLGVMLGFGRLSMESELVVMRASGISFRQIALPVMFFAVVVFAISLIIGFWVRPYANHRFGLGTFEIAKMRASSGLVPGVFNEFGPLTIFAERVTNPGGRLNNVILSDRRNPDQAQTFVARHGSIVSDDIRRTLTLQLYEGSIHQSGGQNYNLTIFDINNIQLEQSALFDSDATRDGKKTNEMYLGELNQNIQQIQYRATPLGEEDTITLRRLLVEYHRRFALPASSLCIALVALALGIQSNRGGKTWGPVTNMIAGILVIVVYYALLAFSAALGEQGNVAPNLIGAILWIPNVLFAAVAIYFFRKIESEQWLVVSEAIAESVSRAVKRFFPRRMVS